MTNKDNKKIYEEILKILPISDEKISQEIGISTKTLYRLRKGEYISDRTKEFFFNYLERLIANLKFLYFKLKKEE